jgi:hypothetical protein
VLTLVSYPLSFGRLFDLSFDFYPLFGDFDSLVELRICLISFLDAIYIVAGPSE